MRLTPDDNLRCLLIQPAFSAFSFWNYIDAARAIGAKTPSPPLGLITVAAILPQHWEFRLLDLNTREFSDDDWAWADLVLVGGMLPQQKGILEVIARAKAEGKYVVVGGADPSSQPDVYRHADALVVGEGESAIPPWLQSWRAGNPRGIFKETAKPDVTKSPVPRFDLLDFRDYVQVGVQYSRGCPFNCEFCDIIELYGRKPRTKTSQQLLAELTRLKELGYSGSIDIVDDNFIGNKRQVKRDLLPALIAWNASNGYPFFYSTEASMNLSDDDALLELLQKAEFRVVFMGIETPDPRLLLMTQKSQNAIRPIVDRVMKLYDYGIVATAGFIIGFDDEKAGMDRSLIELIESTNINMAMVGLLVALPNTQLTRRLLKEGRLLSFLGKRIATEVELLKGANAQTSAVDVIDQTIAGLNFVTTRDRIEILDEYARVVRTIYEPRRYFDRALRMGLSLRCRSRHRPRLFELKRSIRGFFAMSIGLLRDAQIRWLYLRNMGRLFWRGPVVFEQVMRVMGIYLHFRRQTAYLLKALARQKENQTKMSAELRALVKPQGGSPQASSQ